MKMREGHSAAENIPLRNALRQIAGQAGFTLDTSQAAAVSLFPEQE